jgi:hypothetical protein
LKKRSMLPESLVLIGVFIMGSIPGIVQRQSHSRIAQSADMSANPKYISDSSPTIPEVTYKVATSMRSRIELILEIVVKPEDFTHDKMVMLARQLNKDYLGESRMYAVIFDSEEAARNYNPAGGSYSISKKLERGEYFLDRIKGREYINFSSQRGKPVDEIKIILSNKFTPTKKRKSSAR